MLPLCSELLLLLVLARSAQSAPASRPQYFKQRLPDSSLGAPGNQSFDYVVVGGGTAGLTIAARLAEDPSTSVAVIEAGGFYENVENSRLSIPANDVSWIGKDPTDTNPLVDWGFVTTPQAGALNTTLHYARGKCLGGSSARHFMAYQIGTKESYKMWADMAGDQSYSYEDFLPFFQKSISFTPPDSSTRPTNATPEYDLASLGNEGGPLSVTFASYVQAFSTWVQRGFHELGIPSIAGFTSGKLLGSSYALATIQVPSRLRESSETAFLQFPSNTTKTNLVIFQSSLAKRILFDYNKKARGVQVNTDGVAYTLSARKEIVLSAGAFQSPQLLMVSGVGPAASLRKHRIPVVADRPGVGQNMWDHIQAGPTYRVNFNTGTALGDPQFAADALEMFNSNQTGPLTSPGADFLAWEKIPQPLRSSFSSSTLNDLSSFPPDWPEAEYIPLANYIGYNLNLVRDSPRDGYNYATVVMALVAPLSRGTIDISSADTADPPIIDPQWLTHPTDQAVAVAAYKRARQMFHTNAMQPALIGPEYFPGEDEVASDEEILELIRKSFSTIYHAACTCSMGRREDPNAVVDAKAKVIGVQGLRVVDASSFPLLPPGHPQSTV
ncbi:MAG: hypothetical protein M1816_000499, partial [Peltula sp. TS41687]